MEEEIDLSIEENEIGAQVYALCKQISEYLKINKVYQDGFEEELYNVDNILYDALYYVNDLQEKREKIDYCIRVISEISEYISSATAHEIEHVRNYVHKDSYINPVPLVKATRELYIKSNSVKMELILCHEKLNDIIIKRATDIIMNEKGSEEDEQYE